MSEAQDTARPMDSTEPDGTADPYAARGAEEEMTDAAARKASEGNLTPEGAPAATTAEPETESLGGNWFYVAASPALKEVRWRVRQVAGIEVPVLLLGESGTGKEVIARLIHKESQRSQRVFTKVNCAALPVELLESELFGYEAGAFTGAQRSKPGKFELSHGGTMLLDEIAEMPIPPQAKLLHVLQDGEFSRLGSTTTSKVDVRVIAATNVDIHEAIENRRFRADLYYRLNAFTIQLPALRDRREDIPILLDHFGAIWAKRYKRPPLQFSFRVREACLRYPWPGNVRELENFVKNFLILGDEDQALAKLGGPDPVVELNRPAVRAEGANGLNDLKSMVRGLKREAERDAILQVLGKVNGSRKEAAKILHISLRALHYKIRQYAIDQPRNRYAATDSLE